MTCEVSMSRILVDCHIVGSKSEGKRLIRQGAIEVDGVVLTRDEVTFRDGVLVKVGKRRWFRFRDSSIVDKDVKKGRWCEGIWINKAQAARPDGASLHE